MKHYALLRKSDYTDLGTKSGAAENAALATSRETKGLTSNKSGAAQASLASPETPGKPGGSASKTTPHGFEP